MLNAATQLAPLVAAVIRDTRVMERHALMMMNVQMEHTTVLKQMPFATMSLVHLIALVKMVSLVMPQSSVKIAQLLLTVIDLVVNVVACSLQIQLTLTTT